MPGLAYGSDRDRIAWCVTDCERTPTAGHDARLAVYDSHINRTGPMLIHAANAITLLDQAGLTIDEFIEFWGNLLIVERGGNGDNWYDRCQVAAFCAE